MSLRKQPVWAKQSTRGGATGGGGASGRKGADNSQRVIVFVAGGMTYSELRTAYELSDSLGKNVYIGTLEILSLQRTSLTICSGLYFDQVRRTLLLRKISSSIYKFWI